MARNTIHVGVPRSDEALLNDLAERLGRHKTTIIGLAISWFVRHPTLGDADPALLEFIHWAQTGGLTPKDLRSLSRWIEAGRLTELRKLLKQWD